MNEIIQELDLAFKYISAIPVSGDSVDNMAIARAKLRNVYAKLKEMDAENETDKTE